MCPTQLYTQCVSICISGKVSAKRRQCRNCFSLQPLPYSIVNCRASDTTIYLPYSARLFCNTSSSTLLTIFQYSIVISELLKDIERLKKSGNKSVLKKLAQLFLELQQHLRTGTGQVEQLKYYEVETLSRRINSEHRLVYRVQEQTITVLVLSAFGHYK
jgi:toxin YoeB